MVAMVYKTQAKDVHAEAPADDTEIIIEKPKKKKGASK